MTTLLNMANPVSLIVADCPWKFGDKLPGTKRGAERNYRVLTVDELCAYEIPMGDTLWSVANCPGIMPSAILCFWRVASMQEEALRVMRAWGFTCKSEIVWRKRTKNGKRHFGMGRYVRMEHEVCLIGARGAALSLVQRKNVRSTFAAPMPLDAEGRVIHSAKPDRFFQIVERLFAGPRLELFARKRREGWIQYGDQLGSL